MMTIARLGTRTADSNSEFCWIYLRASLSQPFDKQMCACVSKTTCFRGTGMKTVDMPGAATKLRTGGMHLLDLLCGQGRANAWHRGASSISKSLEGIWRFDDLGLFSLTTLYARWLASTTGERIVWPLALRAIAQAWYASCLLGQVVSNLEIWKEAEPFWPWGNTAFNTAFSWYHFFNFEDILPCLLLLKEYICTDSCN